METTTRTVDAAKLDAYMLEQVKNALGVVSASIDVGTVLTVTVDTPSPHPPLVH